MDERLDKLREDGVIDDVRARLMSGKEASVYVVERKGELVAAKVYKSRDERTFKATASYTEGRNQTRNTRDKRAMHKRTSYGRELIEKSWRDMEYEALSMAFHAGVRVPEPIMLYEDVLLMQLLVDEQGCPAPRLADFELPPDVAELLHREIYGQVRLLLAAGYVHGDLSAFNILIADAGPTIIDLPQVVDAAANTSAKEILARDLRNVTEHLAKFDARLLRFRDCGYPLFDHWQRGTLERAADPLEGSVRGGDAHHRSRRARDAERGRMGRGGPPEAREGGPRPSGPSDGRHPGPRHDGPRPDQRRDGPRHEGPRRDGPRPEQQRDGPRHEGPRHDGPRHDGPRHDGPRGNGPRRDGPPRDDRAQRPPPPPHPPRDDRPRAPEGDGRQRRDDRGPPPPRRPDGRRPAPQIERTPPRRQP